MELKRNIVNMDTFRQLKRYKRPLQERYPQHLIIGYLAGKKCLDWPALRADLANERINVRLVGNEIPRKGELKDNCNTCRAGYYYGHQVCPYCESV